MINWQHLGADGVVIAKGSDFPTPSIEPGQTIIITAPEEPEPAPVRLEPEPSWPQEIVDRLDALEARCDHHFGVVDPDTGGVVRKAMPRSLVHAALDAHTNDRLNLETMEEWVRPTAWNVTGDAAEQKRTRVLLEHLHGLVQTALRSERIPKPGE